MTLRELRDADRVGCRLGSRLGGCGKCGRTRRHRHRGPSLEACERLRGGLELTERRLECGERALLGGQRTQFLLRDGLKLLREDGLVLLNVLRHGNTAAAGV